MAKPDFYVFVIVVPAILFCVFALIARGLYLNGKFVTIQVMLLSTGLGSLCFFLISAGTGGYDGLGWFLIAALCTILFLGVLGGTVVAWMLNRRAQNKAGQIPK